MDREKTLERIKDMINPSYFEDAVAWALNSLGIPCVEEIPRLFGDHTPLQNAFEDYIKYLLFTPDKDKIKPKPAVVCMEYTHHEIYLAGDEGDLIPDKVVDSCWDDDPTYRVIDEGGEGEWLDEFGSDYEGAKRYCEMYNRENH